METDENKEIDNKTSNAVEVLEDKKGTINNTKEKNEQITKENEKIEKKKELIKKRGIFSLLYYLI